MKKQLLAPSRLSIFNHTHQDTMNLLVALVNILKKKGIDISEEEVKQELKRVEESL